MNLLNVINLIGYYEELVKEDYYISGGEFLGKWIGLGVCRFCFLSEIDIILYWCIFNGFGFEGEELCENVGNNYCVGWDLIFFVLKSVLILWVCVDEVICKVI